jgi:hypothetical protein
VATAVQSHFFILENLMKNLLVDTTLNLVDCLQEILNTGYIDKNDHNYQWVENEIRQAKEQLAYARLCESTQT